MNLEKDKNRMLFLLYLTCDCDLVGVFKDGIDNAIDKFNVGFYCNSEGMGHVNDIFVFRIIGNEKVKFEMMFKDDSVEIFKFFEDILITKYKLKIFNRRNTFTGQLLLSFDDSLEIKKDTPLASYTFDTDILTSDNVNEKNISNTLITNKKIIGNGPGGRGM